MLNRHPELDSGQNHLVIWGLRIKSAMTIMLKMQFLEVP